MSIYLVDSQGILARAVPLAKLVLATPDTLMSSLAQEPFISTPGGEKENQVAQLFDRYNLLTLPVVDTNKKLTGVITSDDIISLPRANLLNRISSTQKSPCAFMLIGRSNKYVCAACP